MSDEENDVRGAALMNWPPSRGENPYEPIFTTYTVGEIQREDIEPQHDETQETEIEVLHTIEIDGEQTEFGSFDEAIAALVGMDDSEEPADGETATYKRRERKPVSEIEGRFFCFYRVEQVATLKVEQAIDILQVQSAFETEDGEQVYGSAECWHNYDTYNADCSFEVEIDYPLSIAVRLMIPPLVITEAFKDGHTEEMRVMTPGYLMWVVAQEYLRIYREHKKYGIWGHALGDLIFEGFEIKAGGKIDLLMGS